MAVRKSGWANSWGHWPSCDIVLRASSGPGTIASHCALLLGRWKVKGRISRNTILADLESLSQSEGYF